MNDRCQNLSMAFCNSTEAVLTFLLEPWADAIHIEPQSEIILQIESDDGTPVPPRFDISTEIVAVYAAVGHRIRVFVDGVVQESRSCVIACPGWDTESYAKLHGLDYRDPPREPLDGD